MEEVEAKQSRAGPRGGARAGAPGLHREALGRPGSHPGQPASQPGTRQGGITVLSIPHSPA